MRDGGGDAVRNFGWAVERLAEGKDVARREWSVRRIALRLDPGTNPPDTAVVLRVAPDGSTGYWAVSHADIFATDWEVALGEAR
jgi:Protein of unknown function (DUF2829)